MRDQGLGFSLGWSLKVWGVGRAAPFVNGDDGIGCGGEVYEGRAGRGFGFWGLGFGPLLRGHEKQSSGIIALLNYVLGPILRGHQGLGFRRLFGAPKAIPRA